MERVIRHLVDTAEPGSQQQEQARCLEGFFRNLTEAGFGDIDPSKLGDVFPQDVGRSTQEEAGYYKFSTFEYDSKKRTILIYAPDGTGTTIRLSKKTNSFLKLFACNPGGLISYINLVEAGLFDNEEKSESVAKKYVQNLRKILGEKDLFTNVMGEGYIFNAKPKEVALFEAPY